MPTLERGFRPDINGLRAIAVISVLLFHFDLPGFRGGFVGVDIFFVISGYLMTQIIVSGLNAGSFSIRQFYVARARRIVPALVVMCAFVLVVGFARLAPPDYEAIARHALSSLLFLSNFDYMHRSSYFDALNSENWLLHTWSLSIEFQFYLFYPVLLVSLCRWRRRPGTLALWVGWLFICSYLLSALPQRFQPFSAFYVLPTRAWEMLGGGLVCLSPPMLIKMARRGRPLFLGGTVLIILSIGLMSSAVKWPGRLAMVPVLGAIMLLLARDQKSWIATNRVSQFFGKASYSIYLWHWPLVGLFNQLPIQPLMRMGLGVASSIMVGWLSFRLVETPGRHWLTKQAHVAFPRGFGTVLLATALGAVLVAAGHGLPKRDAMRDFQRLTQDVRYVHVDEDWCFVDNRTLNIPYRPGFSTCDLGDLAARRSALLWGDSHAGHFTPLVAELAKAANVKLRVMGTPECWPTLQGEKLGINPEVCAHFRDDVARTAKDFDWIILAARWDSTGRNHWDDDVRNTLKTLAATGKKVVVLRQVPLFEIDIAHRYVYDGLFGNPARRHYPRVLASDVQNDMVRQMVAVTPNAAFVDVTSTLCARSDGDCDVMAGPTMLYADDQHLSVPGAILIGQRLVAAGQNFLR